MRTIAVINQKGGVGKTTTAANLGAAIGVAGYDTCLIDLDPQAHLTLHFGIEPGSTPHSVYDILTQETPLAQAAMMAKPHVWVVPSVIDLAAAEIELVSTVGREQILRDRLEACPLPYEFVLIDCPPSLGLLTLNALAAADEVLIPLQPHFLGLQGLGKLLETVSLVQRRINPRLRVNGVVLCLYERNTRLANEVLADLQNFFTQARNTNLPWSGARIFNTVIRRNIKLAECPSFGKTIFDYEPSSNGAEDYRNLAKEFLNGMPPPQPKVMQPVAAPAPPPVPTVTFRPAAAAPAPAIAECGMRNADSQTPMADDDSPGADPALAAAPPPALAECGLRIADSPSPMAVDDSPGAPSADDESSGEDQESQDGLAAELAPRSDAPDGLAAELAPRWDAPDGLAAELVPRSDAPDGLAAELAPRSDAPPQAKTPATPVEAASSPRPSVDGGYDDLIAQALSAAAESGLTLRELAELADQINLAHGRPEGP